MINQRPVTLTGEDQDKARAVMFARNSLKKGSVVVDIDIRAPSVCVIDFFAGRDWLQREFSESSQKFKIHREADNLALYRLPAVDQVDRLEDSLYWLLSAAMIVYFLLGIIGG